MRRILPVLFVLVLLAGWQAALEHPLEHVDSHGHLVHLADAGHGDESSPEPSDRLCDALGALTACVADSPMVFGPVDLSAEIAFLERRAALPGSVPPFLSQGPPAVS